MSSAAGQLQEKRKTRQFERRIQSKGQKVERVGVGRVVNGKGRKRILIDGKA